MALERVPADIRAEGGVSRMVSNITLSCMHTSLTPQSDPAMIKDIISAVTIPVMAKVRIGHFVEAQVRLTCVHSCSYLIFVRSVLDTSSCRCRLYR